VSFGTGKTFRFLAAHEIARALGPEKAQALPMFHALTGCECDTVSCFAGHGKRTAWAVWTVLPELTQTLTFLSTAPDHINEDAMHTIEVHHILLYDRTSPATDIDKGTSQTICKEKQRPADPTNKDSPGTARPTSSIPGRALGIPVPDPFSQSRDSGLKDF